MGFRFRKSVKILPGIKLNFGKKGVSTTIGGRGLSVNVGSRGTYLNAGIPGTGISYRERIDGTGNNQNYGYQAQPRMASGVWIVLAILGGFFLLGTISTIGSLFTSNTKIETAATAPKPEPELLLLPESDDANVAFNLRKTSTEESGDTLGVEGTLVCYEAPCPKTAWIGFYAYAPYGTGSVMPLPVKVDKPFGKNKLEYKFSRKLTVPNLKEAGGGLYLRTAVSTSGEEAVVALLKSEERGIRNSRPILAYQKLADDSYRWVDKKPPTIFESNINKNNSGNTEYSSSSSYHSGSTSGDTVQVRGYYRRNGTYVRSYTRRR